MRRTTTALLAAACLALGGCSSGGEPTKTVTATVTATPSLSNAEAKAVCVDAWLAVMKADDYDPDAGLDARPGVCEGLSGQAGMYAEALAERNAANRRKLDECVDDPSCTSVPIP